MWGFDKIEHIPRKPPGKGVLLGLEGHGQLEHFFKTGEDVRGPLAKAGDHMLDDVRHTFPFLGGGGLVESSLTFGDVQSMRTPGGIEFVGFVDYAAKFNADHAIIIDHKFTKSVEKYPVTDADLENDEQAIVYGYWAAQRFDVSIVEFRLNRYQTEGRKVFAAPKTIASSLRWAGKFAELAHEVDTVMAPLAKLTKAADAKPNTSACGKYGGCDYAKICPYSPVNRWLSNFTTTNQPAAAESAKEEKMGLMDTLNKAAPAAPAAFVPLKRILSDKCEAEKEYILPGGTVGIFKAIAGGNAFFVGKTDSAPRMLSVTTEVTIPADPVPVVAVPAVVIETKPTAAVVSILPPDAPVSKPAAPLETVQAAAAPATVTEAPAAVEPKKGPGRPKGSKKAAETEVAEVETSNGDAAGTGGLILLVDCACTKPAQDLNSFVALIARELAEKAEVLDIRIAPKKTKEGHDNPLAFGGWKAMLSGIALKALPKGLCSINSSELTEPVIEALAGVASIVVRGSR